MAIRGYNNGTSGTTMSVVAVSRQSVKEAALVTTKQVAIGITFAALYFALVALNPFATLTGAASLGAFLNIRWAHILRGFSIFSPASIVGIAAGGHMWNVYSGKAMLFSYGFTPMLNAAIGVGTYLLGTKGKNPKRDIAVLAVAGALTGLVVSARLAGFAMVLDSEVWTSLLTYGVLWKVVWHSALYVSGYWFARMFFVEG